MLGKVCNGFMEGYRDVTKDSTLDSTFCKESKKVEHTFNQNLNSHEDLVDILTNLEQSGNSSDNDINVGVSELHLQTDSNNEFARQGLDQANGYYLIENQECEQVSIQLQKVVV